MNITSLLNSAKKNAKQLAGFNASKFDIKDIDGELCVVYGDGASDKIPPLKFRPYQQEAHDALFVKGITRFFLVRPRRAGKETESWNFLVESAIRRPGLYIMMYPNAIRGRTVLWDGAISLPDKSSLRFLDMIPKRLIVGKPNQAEMKVVLSNGAVIRIMGADSAPDKMRGTNPLGVVFSEYAYSDPRVYQTIMPALRQNGGWAILQTTFDGMNHAYRYMQEVRDNPEWYCRVDSALTLLDENGERYVTDKMIDEDRKAGMAEFMIQQEYFSSIEPNESNIYFVREIKFIDEKKRIVSDLMLRAPVYTAWDIGMNDSTAICFFQMDAKGDPIIINYLENHNKNLEWYINEIIMYCTKNSLVHAMAFMPHDGQKRDFTNTATRTIAEEATLAGIRSVTVDRPSSKIVAIQRMRQMLYRTQFNKENCGRLMECLTSYSKVFDEKNDVFKDHPLHNWTTHGVDSYQTMTIAILDKKIPTGSTYGVVYMGGLQGGMESGQTMGIRR